ncbi:HNH endonuclease [Mammaliicoccus sciuri]|uniref:HNH endonuclease n=1 Tax=Mammaliicoccus sciuri TaxID=1296 RepID=UPI003F557427
MKSLEDINDVAILENGLFEVHRDGTIYRNTKKGKVLCSQYKTARNRRYLAVSATINKKQKHFYVHRLLAQAFIPNPLNKPQVNHKDGNPSNNDLNNLEWVTASENVQHAYDTGLNKPLSEYGSKCKMCDELTASKNRFCYECKKTLQRELTESSRRIDISTMYLNLNPEHLTKTQRKIYELRKNFLTVKEISQMLGISRQAVDCSIKNGINRDRWKKNKIAENKYKSSYTHLRGNKLWNLRKSNGIGQEEMADLLDMTKVTYMKKEKDFSLFKLSEVYEICEFFDCDLNEIFGKE